MKLKQLQLILMNKEQIEMNKMLEKQREEERQRRLRMNDDRAFQNFSKINQMFIQR